MTGTQQPPLSTHLVRTFLTSPPRYVWVFILQADTRKTKQKKDAAAIRSDSIQSLPTRALAAQFFHFQGGVYSRVDSALAS